MKKNILLSICIVCASIAQAQSVAVSLPKYAGKMAYVTAAAGIRNDTIGALQLNGEGKGTLKTTASLPAIATLRIKDKNAAWSFIVSPRENITIHCAEENPTPTNTRINNSPENDAFMRWGNGMAVQQQQQELGAQLAGLYNSKDPLAVTLGKEQQRLKKSLKLVTDTINRSRLYAAEFFRINNFLNKYGPALTAAKQDTAVCEAFREYFRDTLGMEALYGSTKWYEAFMGAVALYRDKTDYNTQGAFYNDFVSDMAVVLARTQNAEVYNTLANDLLMICEQMAWDKRRDDILKNVVASGRITNPTPFMKKLLGVKQLNAGDVAPPIQLGNGKKLTDIPADKYVVLFFESGCPHCENELRYIKANYNKLTAQKIAVLSISSDTDQKVFETTTSTFSWLSLCDLKGLTGENFKNFGVTGTPTLFVLDKGGKIVGKYATLEQAGL